MNAQLILVQMDGVMKLKNTRQSNGKAECKRLVMVSVMTVLEFHSGGRLNLIDFCIQINIFIGFSDILQDCLIESLQKAAILVFGANFGMKTCTISIHGINT